jgi:predicted Rossmann fold nucleotide-binding protein DprA/Smf involved in DNA uptake
MIKQLKMHRHSDETINTSLYYLRAQIIREGADGLEHVEALMKLRGLALDALPVPEKRNRRFRKGQLRQAILDELRKGPRTSRQIAEAIGHERNNFAHTLQALKARGVVRLDGRVWTLIERSEFGL